MIANKKNLIGLDLSSSGKEKEAYKILLKFKRSLGAGDVAGKTAAIAFGGIGGTFKKGAKRTDNPVSLVRQENYNSAFSENVRFLSLMSNYRQTVGKKYSASKSGGNVYYVLTSLKAGGDKGSGLVGVNMLSGPGENQIIFFSTKIPIMKSTICRDVFST